jgi:hypothetical protein
MRFRVALALAGALIGSSALGAQLPPQTVSGLIDSQLPTNDAGTISAAAARAVLHDIVDSTPWLTAFYPTTNTASSYAFQQSDQAKSTTFTAVTAALSLAAPGGLPPATGGYFPPGWWTVITASSLSTLTLTPPTGVLINGAANLTIAPTQVYLISTDGLNYYATALGGSSGGGGGLGALPTAVSGTVNSGGVPCFTSSIVMASSGVLAANSIVIGGGIGACPQTVATNSAALAALSIAPGSVGSVLINGGAGGTPSSLNLTNASNLPIGGIAGLGTGVGAALGQGINAASGMPLLTGTFTGNDCLQWTAFGIADAGFPCSLGSSITVNSTAIVGGTSGHIVFDNAGTFGEMAGTGTGQVVLSNSPTLTTPNLGTPSAITLTSASGLPISTGLTGAGTGVLSALQAASNATGGIALVNATPTATHCLEWTAGGIGDAGGACGGISTISVGGTAIAGGTSGRVLYDNAGIFGELPVTGTGNVVLATNPAISLANGTGLPISTGVSGLGSGVATAAAIAVNTTGGLATYGSSTAKGSAGFASLLDYGGIASTATGTCTTTASSHTLSCSSVADFAIGNGIRIDKAGSTFTLGTPSAPTITPCASRPSDNTCSPGSTSYAYECAAIDGNGGVGVASSAGTTSTGPATLGANAFNYVNCASVAGAAGYVVYGNKSGSLALIGITWGTTAIYDFGSAVNPTAPADDWLPTSPLGTAQNDWLLTTVTNVSGSTITVAGTAGHAVSSGTAYHDNSAALTSALAASANSVVIPCGIFETIGLTYALSNALTITGNGCGQLELTTTVLGTTWINVVGGTTIEDLTVTSEESGSNINGALQSLISCSSSCTGLVIDHNAFYGVPTFGLYVGPGYGINITNNLFFKNTARASQNKCIDIGSSGSDIVYSYITGNACVGTGMQLYGSNSSFSNNSISGWGYGGGMGIGGDNGSFSDTINDNNVTGSLTGVDINNTILDCYETYVAYSTLTGNHGDNCGGTGLLVNGEGDAVVGNNMVDNGTAHGGGLNQSGIAVQYITGGINGSGAFSTVTGNALSNSGAGTQLYGIYASSSALTFCEQGNSGESLSSNVVLNGATNSCF